MRMEEKGAVSKAATPETAKEKESQTNIIRKDGEKKEAPCTLWPDVKPKIDHTGRKQALLTYIHPVGTVNLYGRSRDWVWLCLCDCGNEKLVRARSAYKSCGCLRYKRWKTNKSAEPLPKEVVFNRGVVCIKNGTACRFYKDCQEERLRTGKVSAKYRELKGACYV